MKKATLILTLFLAAFSFSFSSCEKDDITPDNTPQTVEKSCCDDNGDLPPKPKGGGQ